MAPHSSPSVRLVRTHAFNACGDLLVAIALAGTLFFDVPTGEARARVALYLLLTMAPFSLLAPLIGPAIDRPSGGHRIAITFAAIGRAALALFMSSTHNTVLLYPATFGILVLSRAHAVARSALLPQVVEGDGNLVAANAQLVRAAVIGGALVAGPGLMIQKIGGSPPTLIAAAVMFSLGSMMAATLPGRRKDRRTGEREARPRRTPDAVMRALQVNAVIRGVGGFLLMLLAFGLRARGIGGAGFGLVLGASALGSFVGASIIPRLRRGTNEGWVLAISLFAGATASLFAAGSFGTDLAAVVGGTVGMMTNAGRLALDSLTQRTITDAHRGRMFARFETLLQLAWVTGALIPVLVPIGIELGLAIASAAFIGAALWYLVGLGPEGRRALSD